MPSYQGEMDGLCGIYAIMNAYEECGVAKNSEVHEGLFQTCCEALGPKQWPKVLWQGLYFSDLKRMLKACRGAYPELADISVKYPFQGNAPKSNADFWKQFNTLLRNEEGLVKCAVIGTTRPTQHWIVAARSGNRVKFSDSRPDRPSVSKNQKSLFAGERNGNPNVWLIERGELILFTSAT